MLLLTFRGQLENVNVHVKGPTQKCGENETHRSGFFCLFHAVRVIIIVQLVRYLVSPSLFRVSCIFDVHPNLLQSRLFCFCKIKTRKLIKYEFRGPI